MTFYLTKVWGFGKPVGPLQFSSQGWRNNALEKLQPGDHVVLVGTMGDQTRDDMKGRLLGITEPTTEPVMSLDFAIERPSEHFVDGEYKWPFGLMNLRAWSLPDRPLLYMISDRKFGMDSAQGIVRLDDMETAQVRGLRWTEEELLQPTAAARERMQRKYGAAKRAAPVPTTTRRGVMHLRRAEAHTYSMRIIGARPAAFKIGWAFDFGLRAHQFNHSAMPDLGGLEYEPHFHHRWDSARQAYAMEQNLLTRFESQRHPYNNEIVVGITPEDFEKIWNDTVFKMRHQNYR